MSLKISLFAVTISLSVFSLAQGMTVDQQRCKIEMLGYVDTYPPFIFYAGDDIAPFTGWTYTNFVKEEGYMINTISSVRSIYGVGCDHCTIALFSTKTHRGENVTYNFKEESSFELPFDAESLTLDCEGEEPMEQYEGIPGVELYSEGLENLRGSGYAKAYEAAKAAKILSEEGDYVVSFSGGALRSTVNSEKYMFGYFLRGRQPPEYLLMFSVLESSGELVSWELKPVAN